VRTPQSQTGFSIVELVTVIAIISILLTIVTLNYNQWQKKSQIERQTRELMADLNMARSESIYRKKQHAIIMSADAKGYILRRYSSADEKRITSTPAAEIVVTKKVNYLFSKENGNSIADSIFQFDITGFTATPADNDTIRVNPTMSGAAFDCVVVSNSRINIGQMSSGGSCVQN
jgi:prepilin-type N-terminal cleavage/methylation domain-containing protein